MDYALLKEGAERLLSLLMEPRGCYGWLRLIKMLDRDSRLEGYLSQLCDHLRNLGAWVSSGTDIAMFDLLWRNS